MREIVNFDNLIDECQQSSGIANSDNPLSGDLTQHQNNVLPGIFAAGMS
ncbi:MAG: hypothetical protein K2Y09_12515 [Nitrosomonas sp.]|nr:hypothetical protein [Nitrosomonas sp.]